MKSVTSLIATVAGSILIGATSTKPPSSCRLNNSDLTYGQLHYLLAAFGLHFLPLQYFLHFSIDFLFADSFHLCTMDLAENLTKARKFSHLYYSILQFFFLLPHSRFFCFVYQNNIFALHHFRFYLYFETLYS